VLTFELAYRPPYDWESMLAFLGGRAIDGVERVDDDGYARTVAIEHRGARHAGRVEVRRVARRPALSVAMSPSSGAGRACRAFAREEHVRSRVRSALVGAALGPRWPTRARDCACPATFDGFELAVRAVVGQQISVRCRADDARAASPAHLANRWRSAKLVAPVSERAADRGAGAGGPHGARAHERARPNARAASPARCKRAPSVSNPKAMSKRRSHG
jgi:hypothetical protein